MPRKRRRTTRRKKTTRRRATPRRRRNPNVPAKDLMLAGAAGLAVGALAYALAGSDTLTQMQTGLIKAGAGAVVGGVVAKVASPAVGMGLIGAGLATGGEDIITAGVQMKATADSTGTDEETPDLGAVYAGRRGPRRRLPELGAVQADLGRGDRVTLNAVQFMDTLVA